MSSFQRERLEKRIGMFLLPLIGGAIVVFLWAVASGTFLTNLPSPGRTWEVSRL